MKLYKKFASYSVLCLTLCACTPAENRVAEHKHANGGVNAAAISQDGRYSLVASTRHDAVGLWDLNQNSLLYEWRHKAKVPANIVAVSISANNQFALTAEKFNIVLWDIESGKALFYWQTPHRILDVALSRKGSRALIGMVDGYAEYLDLQTGQSIFSLSEPDDINTVALSVDGRYAITGGANKVANVWDLQRGQLHTQWHHSKAIQHVDISANSRYALTATQQGQIQLWDLNRKHSIQQFNQHPDTLTASRFSSDERYVALGLASQQMELWQLQPIALKQTWSTRIKTNWKPQINWIQAIHFKGTKNQLLTEDSTGVGAVWAIQPSH